ncbi:MAG: Ig-like domain-containing protein [Bacteroidota bacterium]
MKKISLTALLFLTLSCNKEESTHEAVVPQLDQAQLELHTLDIQNLSITNLTAFGTDASITWSSDDESVAMVDNQGQVTATGAGETQINVTVDNSMVQIPIIVKPSIFASGIVLNESQGTINAALWKNNELIELTNESPFASSSEVFINGTDIYATITDGRNGNDAFVWKNGETSIISNDPNKSESIFSLFIRNSKTYVGGNIIGNATIWEDGIPTVLEPNYLSSINAVHIDDQNNVYASGSASHDNNYSTALIWVNGQPISLTEGNTYARTTDLFVDDNDIYVVGYESPESDFTTNSQAVLWKNGVRQNLSDTNSIYFPSSIYVDEANVYVAGNERVNGILQARLWINGEVKTLTQHSNASNANSLFVHQGDVYIGGFNQASDEAIVWKLIDGDINNLIQIKLPINIYDSASVFSIIVK